MAENDPVQRVVDVLHSVGSYSRRPNEALRDRGFSFDVVMTGKDPMSIIVIEYKERADEKTLRDCVRELRSFVWSLFADGKRHMVSTVLVMGEEVPGSKVAGLLKDLSGTCRTFVVSKNMTAEELQAEFVSLGEPKFVKMHPEESENDRFVREMSTMRGKAKREFAAQLIDLVRGSQSVSEVSRRLLESYKKRLREVENATAESKN